MKKPVLSAPVPLKMLPADHIRWVQNQLKVGGFYQGGIDGICGNGTLNAFNEFKDAVYLGQPGAIGDSSIDLLARLKEPHQASEQSENLAQVPNRRAGEKSGASAKLPLVGLVYANEYVVPEFPFFTWGEFTKNMTRLPNSEALVRNALALARVCGPIRQRHSTIWAITSAYRPPDVNRAVGGVPNSRHTLFCAMDVHPVNSDYSGLVKLARQSKRLDEIGLAGNTKGFIHLAIKELNAPGGPAEEFVY